MLLLLAISAIAAPWTAESSHSVALTQPLTALAVDQDGAWAVGPQGAVLYGADLELARTVPRAAQDVLLTQQMVWLCGQAGVLRVDRDTGVQESITDRACEAIASGPIVWLDDEVHTVAADGSLTVLGAAVQGQGAALLAAADGVVVASRVGSTAVVEWSDFGRSVFRAAGPVAAVAVFGGGARWSRADSAVLEGASREGLPLPAIATQLSTSTQGRVAAGLLAGGAALIEPGSGVTGVQAATVQTVAVALDGGDCPALWVLGERRLTRVEGRCSEPVVRPSVPLVRVGPEEPSVAVVAGDSLTVQLVSPHEQAVTWQARSNLPGVNLSAEGLLTVTTTHADVGRHRVSLRMSAPPSVFTTGALWVDVAARPAVPTPGRDLANNPETSEPDAEAPQRWGSAAYHGYQLGVGLGVSRGGSSWQSIGRPIALAPSPALAMFFSGGGATTWTVGAETMPTLLFDLARGRSIHLVGLTAGLSWGNESFQVGPYVSAGLRYSGVGARLLWLPVQREDTSKGVELRLFGYVPSGPSGHVALLYTFREGR